MYIVGVLVMPTKGHKFVWLVTTTLDIADIGHAHHLQFHWKAMLLVAPGSYFSGHYRHTIGMAGAGYSFSYLLALEYLSTSTTIYPKISSFLFITVYKCQLYSSLTTTEITQRITENGHFNIYLICRKLTCYSSLMASSRECG